MAESNPSSTDLSSSPSSNESESSSEAEEVQGKCDDMDDDLSTFVKLDGQLDFLGPTQEDLEKFVRKVRNAYYEISDLMTEDTIPAQTRRKFTSKIYIKNMEVAKDLPIPEAFQQRLSFPDPLMHDKFVMPTPNKASKIFHSIAYSIFHSREPAVVNQVKLIYLGEVEKEYLRAKRSGDCMEICRCVRLVKRVSVEVNEPWTEEEFILASRAYFAPIHVLFHCPRLPAPAHITRYLFSPVIQNEIPVRIIVDNGDLRIPHTD